MKMALTTPKESENSEPFSLEEWSKKRIEYWQPVLYFPHKIDFNICAKNGCSSIKGYLTWIYSPDSLNSKFAPDWNSSKLKKEILASKDDTHAADRIYDFHTNCKRATRISRWQNDPTTNYRHFCRSGSHRVAIKRDPIQRFLSGYLQIWEESAISVFKQHSYAIDELIDKLSTGEYWNEHLETQTFWMGNSVSFFDAVFDVSETQECINHIHSQSKYKGDAPKIHLMPNTYEKPTLTRYQISKIEKLYLEDYENGWY